MSCRQTELDLVSYHFGVIDADARARVEAHLLTCSSCLRSLFAMKRDIEETAEAEDRPSPRARAALRAAVSRELEDRERASSRRARWQTRLAFAFASAAVVSAVFATGSLAMGEGARPRGAGAAQGHAR